MWQKQMEETMCMARQVSSFSLTHGDDTSCVLMKLKTSKIDKWEIMTMGHCFKKCCDNGCVLCNTTHNGSTRCICMSGILCLAEVKIWWTFFFKSIFFQKGFRQPPFFFSHFGEFSPPKNAAWALDLYKSRPTLKSNQGPL